MRAGRAPAFLGARAAALIAACGLTGSACHRGRLLARGDAAAVVVVEPDAAVAVPTTDETEPNDGTSAAQTIAITEAGPGVTVRGALSARSGKPDVDTFRFVVTVPDDAAATPEPPDGGAADGGVTVRPLALSLELTPAAALACQLQVLDGRGQPSVTVTAAPGERCSVANAPIAVGGWVAVRVRAAAKGATAAEAGYALTARLQAPEPTDELEPNDLVPNEATSFSGRAAVEERAGFFGWPRDVDAWRLPLSEWPADALVTVELEGVEGVEASLAVTDSAGRVLASSRGRSGERVVLRQLAAPPPGAGGIREARVVVKAERGSRFDRRYVLRVRQDAAEPGSEREPNDDVARATAMPDGVSHGYLTSGDADVYRVELDRPVELDVATSGVDRVDVSLALLAADGAPLALADAHRRGEGERLPNVFVERGPVFVRVAARRGEGNPDQSYTLEVRPSEPVPNGEREPNDARERANVVVPGAAATGLLPFGDVDWWALALSPDAATVELAARAPRGTAAELTLETRSGRALAKLLLPAGEEVRRSFAARGEPTLFVRWRASAPKRPRAAAEASSGSDRYELVLGASP